MQGMGYRQTIQRIARQKLTYHELAPFHDFDVDVGGGGKPRTKQHVERTSKYGVRWIVKTPMFRDDVRMLRDQGFVEFRYGPAVIPDPKKPRTFHDMTASRIARNLARRYEKVVADLEQMRKAGLVGRLRDGIWTANPAKFKVRRKKQEAGVMTFSIERGKVVMKPLRLLPAKENAPAR
jgi:hypothetical protein